MEAYGAVFPNASLKGGGSLSYYIVQLRSSRIFVDFKPLHEKFLDKIREGIKDFLELCP